MVNPSLENSKKTSIQQVDYQSWLIVVFREEWGIQKRNQQQHLSQQLHMVQLVEVKISGILSDAWGIAMWTMWAVAAWHRRVRRVPYLWFSYAFWYFLEGCHKSRQFSLGYPDYPKGHVDLCVQTPDFFQQIRGSFWGPKDWITSCQVRRERTVQKRLTLSCFGAHLHFVVSENLGIRIMPWCSWTPT